MKQTTSTKQTLRFSPQQLQVAKLIQASNEELEQLIRQEVENNYALEIDEKSGEDSRQEEPMDSADDNAEYEGETTADGDDEYQVDVERDTYEDETGPLSDMYVNDDYEPESPISADNEEYSPFLNYKDDKTFRSEMFAQLDVMNLSDEEDFLARYLIDSLDEKGYLSRSLLDLVDELELQQDHVTTVNELERVLTEIVQSLEPTGVGARDLRECLLLQIQEKRSTPATQLAYRVVDTCFEDLAAHRVEKICERLECTQTQLSQAYRIISHLAPKPAVVSAGTDRMEVRASHVKADFKITEQDGVLKVSLKDGFLPEVRIRSDASEMLQQIEQKKQKGKDDRDGVDFLRKQIDAGNQFVDSLAQRRNTLSNVIKVIAEFQRDYFLSGCNPEMLKPMVLQDVADRSGYDISTISRVSNSKFIQTDYETIAVKDLFTSGIQTEQGVVSNTAVMECLKEIIDGEDKNRPYSDDALTKKLSEKGYKVARRTVTKYREIMKYPSAKERRHI